MKRLSLPVVFLTVGLLVACEPLAPDQTPRYVVVTSETVASPQPVSQGNGLVVTQSSPAPTGMSSVEGVVSTPVPSETPIPVPTAPPTATPFVCAETTGQVIRASFFSAVTGADFNYRLYLPPCFYETLQRYPYVILMHGTGFDDAMWTDLGAPEVMDKGVKTGSLPPMVLVMPDGEYLSELNDQPDGASYESIILDELIPQLETDYCLWGSRQGRAIGGISRGGFWAFSIAFRYPELFGAVGGHSPHFEPDNAAPENNPLDLARSVTFDKFSLRIYMDNGTNDYVGANAIEMSNILRERGIQHDYLINPTGDHDMAYWQAHVAEYLAFYGAVWPYDPSSLPSCLEPSPQ